MEGGQRRLVIRGACAALLAVLFVGRPAGASSAAELVREARELEAGHEEDRAVRRYTEAIELDPTFGPAYLGLGDLRARRGDAVEAERVYATALEHVPGLDAALLGRARARRSLGRPRDADEDLEVYVLRADHDLLAMKELAAWYGAEARGPAELSVWRRLYVKALRFGADAALVREARSTVRALELFVGLVDPVVSPPGDDPVRLGLASIARRGG